MNYIVLGFVTALQSSFMETTRLLRFESVCWRIFWYWVSLRPRSSCPNSLFMRVRWCEMAHSCKKLSSLYSQRWCKCLHKKKDFRRHVSYFFIRCQKAELLARTTRWKNFIVSCLWRRIMNFETKFTWDSWIWNLILDKSWYVEIKRSGTRHDVIDFFLFFFQKYLPSTRHEFTSWKECR